MPIDDITISPAEVSQAARRQRIFDAAERCFVRNGFHRTTMQDVAAAAEMSVGNLYRYFPSKDAIVLGLSERDRSEAHDLIVGLSDDDLWPALKRLLREHVIESPREKSILCLEIWAEVTRNPRLDEMHQRIEAENMVWFTDFFRRIAGSSKDEVEAMMMMLLTQLKGIMVDRALSASYDAEPAFAHLIASIEAFFPPHALASSDATKSLKGARS
ncbi:TetR/AcrR family transcriptional regulator [Lichenihabitans psoromatis]|uniref:TetR/AcrR family transcriptional regulator n=1 Tax=Lichenihabitans psoromatis TaxID=2528642 RepID=UPI0013F15C06|nr:TetR/AcrR family transcriptional regulator [Lichenihabitans psoromatis]